MTAGPSPLPPALVLGVDTAIGLTVVRELGRHGVPVFAIGRSAHAIGRYSRHVSGFFQRPTDQPMAAWLPDMIRACGAKILLAISEGDLLDLAALPPEIEGCVVATPRRAPLDIVLDKGRTLAAAQAVGIDIPQSWQPQAGDDFAARAATLAYPVVLKWSDPPAMWARLNAAALPFEKAEHVASADALCRALARYNALGAWPLVQTWCRGEGFGQMLMMAGGVARLRFQHRRLREFPASGGVSTLCESVPIDQHQGQMARSEALLRAIGWDGPAMVEYRHDRATGRYWLMEINGRFWGSLPLASQSGAHFAWEHYRAVTDPASAPASPAYRYRRARYLVPDSKRLVQILSSGSGTAAPGDPPVRRVAEIARYCAEFFNPRTGYYVWDITDPRPTMADIIGMIRRRA